MSWRDGFALSRSRVKRREGSVLTKKGGKRTWDLGSPPLWSRVVLWVIEVEPGRLRAFTVVQNGAGVWMGKREGE